MAGNTLIIMAQDHYEIYGEGTPLVLLHGNGGSIKSSGSIHEEFSKKI